MLQVWTHMMYSGLAAEMLVRDTPDHQPLSQHVSPCKKHDL